MNTVSFGTAISRLAQAQAKNSAGECEDGTRFGITWQTGRTFVVKTLCRVNGERIVKEWTTENPAEALAQIVAEHGPVVED